MAIDYDPEKVEKFRVAQVIPYPIIFENLNLGSDWIFKKLKIEAFPAYIILNKTGSVIFTINSIEELEKKLQILANTKK